MRLLPLAGPCRPLQGLLFLLAAGASAMGVQAGCGGATTSSPVIGGESHFLHWCSGSCDEAGLECISGLCTRPCFVAEPSACSAYSHASCTAQSIEPGAVALCDVSCARDLDCAPLGNDYSCAGSFCRAPELSAGSSGAASAGGGASEGSGMGLACATCFQTPELSWKRIGGLAGAQSASYLTPCNSYHHELSAPGGADPRPPLPQCDAAVDGCPSSNLAALNASLQDPALRAVLSTRSLVFGRDARAVDGSVRQISAGLGSFIVGTPCVGTNDSACIEIPPAVSSLVAQLQALDASQLAKDSCASAFPSGSSF